MHKENKKGLPPFCSILSAIGTPTYKLAKFFPPFLTRLTENEYNVTDLFHFAEEICKQDSNLYMASLDVDSLFNNIPLDEPLIFVLIVCITIMRILPKSKSFFRNLLKKPSKNSFLCLTMYSINKLMACLWGFLWVQV